MKKEKLIKQLIDRYGQNLLNHGNKENGNSNNHYSGNDAHRHKRK